MWKSFEVNVPLHNLSRFFDIEVGVSSNTIKVAFIVIMTGSLSLVTIVGNILVIVSIKINRQLQTINNYFILSLACADLFIAVFSMNLYTIYTVIGYWPLGPVLCDLWLALDYVACNASGMNLLVISFDRYFCVTKPLSYPLKRTTQMARMMIAAAWLLSFLLWAPAIFFWQFVVGERTVQEGECYVQLFSIPAITFCTSVIAFYLPVTIMVILYVKISRTSNSSITKNKVVSGQTKDSVYPGISQIVQDKIIKLNDYTSAKPKCHFPHIKRQDEEINVNITTDNYTQEGKGHQNESLCLGVPSLNKKGKRGVKNNYSTQNGFRTNNSKHSFINIIGKFEKRNIGNSRAKMAPRVFEKKMNETPIKDSYRTVKIPKRKVKKPNRVATRGEKVTRTVSAILLVFIITWSPYFVMVLISTFCSICIPNALWTIGYWLAYINSTINPACYALCNATFKKTFKYLLLCQYKKSTCTTR
ncbi:muscarinic acetylcholine receptor M2-like [Hemiscyllium ocellatum]|uniref:muscarinic acetylcholine receptor M2-like n=1 Tax=Hemiscyllium ocellatum TaxID=170820 RepID=UPI0029670C9F|nr:muscarinic acetylcholine receptor M2-like [Hemiscyllium ocellatum]